MKAENISNLSEEDLAWCAVESDFENPSLWAVIGIIILIPVVLILDFFMEQNVK